MSTFSQRSLARALARDRKRAKKAPQRHPLPGFKVAYPEGCWGVSRNDRGRWDFGELSPEFVLAMPVWGEA